MFLQGDNIRLRAIEPRDAYLIHEWENDCNYWHLSNTIQPFSFNIIDEYVKNDTHDIYQAKQVRLMIDLSKSEECKSIGSIDLFEFEPYHLRAGVGILIHKEEDRHQGYADESLKLLSRYCREKLGLKQLFCHISLDNIESLKLFENNGFVKTGIKKNWNRISSEEWEDIAFFQKIL